MAPNYQKRIKAIDPERFQFAFGVFNAAAAMQGPFQNPQNFKLNLVDDDGSIQRISFTDRPENRGMLAVKKEFPDTSEFESISFRILTFPDVLKNKTLRTMGLIRDTAAGEIEIHDAVLIALARAPFTKSGDLDEKTFMALTDAEWKRIETEDSSN